MKPAGRSLAGVVLLAAFCLVPPEAGAIRPQAAAARDAAARDAKRFGLDQFQRPRRSEPSAAAVSAFASFNRSNGGSWKIRYSERTGLPAALIEGASAPRAGRPEDAARAFLSEQRGLLGVDSAALSVERTAAGAGSRHVLYRQTYRGLPVEFARVKVHLDERGSVVGFHSRFEPGLSLDIVPAVAAAQAAQAVARDLGGEAPGGGELVIFPDEQTGTSRLAWKFSARRPGGLWRYYVDARTGQVVFRYNDLRFLVCSAAQGTVQGLVYDLDPDSGGAVARPMSHQWVYVHDASTAVATYTDGTYCADGVAAGAVFTQLQGPYVNVSSYRGLSAHYDNGSGLWSTVASAVSSPHPYPNDVVATQSVDISGSPELPVGRVPVKVIPIFSSLKVGSLQVVAGGSTSDILETLDWAGNPVAGYYGDFSARVPFRGAAAPGSKYSLRLSPSGSGQYHGYEVLQSSYLYLTNQSPAGGFSPTWDPAQHTAEARRSEISFFYHLNQMYDFFMAGAASSLGGLPGTSYSPGVNAGKYSDMSSRPLNALAFVGPGLGSPFYDPAHNDINFTDGLPAESPPSATPLDDEGDDATVPRHEYTHYVMERIWPIQNFGQAGSISESMADYFAATSLDFSKIGKYYNRAEGQPLRDLDSTPGVRSQSCTSPSVLSPTGWAGDLYGDSCYLSQALWDLRKDLISQQGSGNGRKCADNLVFQTLLFFPESFQEFEDAMLRVANADLSASGRACDAALFPTLDANIRGHFTSHGLPMGSTSGNSAFETAVDVSTVSSLSATIYPSGDTDFYTFGAGPGAVVVTLHLPADAGDPGYYKGYFLTLYDRSHRRVLMAEPTYSSCDPGDCKTAAPAVTLNYANPSADHFFVQVAGGLNSGVHSSVPYSLDFSYPSPGALTGAIVSAEVDRDNIGFSVFVTTFVRTQDYVFSYAQLRDQARNVIANTRADAAGSYLALVPGSVINALGKITGNVQLAPGAAGGFSERFPSAGTIYLEVFGYNVTGSTVSLGLSQALNLTTNRAALTAYNNIFNPGLGQKATVKYEVMSPGRVTIKLYTLSGIAVATLFDEDVPAGKGSVDWRGTNAAGNTVASGIYLLRMVGPGFSKTQKIVVVK